LFDCVGIVAGLVQEVSDIRTCSRLRCNGSCLPEVCCGELHRALRPGDHAKHIVGFSCQLTHRLLFQGTERILFCFRKVSFLLVHCSQGKED